MATIVTRSGKGSPLSIAEGDANFTNLNNDKIELDDISVTTAAGAETAALSYNNTTGVLTFTPVATGDLIAEISEDTTPQLGGNLDVNNNTITTSVTNGSITIDPNGTGAIIVTGDISTQTNSDLNLNAIGTGSIVLTGTTVELPQPILEWTDGVGKIKAATSIDLNTDTVLFGYDSNTTNVLLTGAVSSNSDITIRASGTGEIILDDPTSINGDFDIKNHSLTTSTTNGNIAIQNNGTGVTTINGGSGLSIATGYLNTGIDTDLVLNPNGTGAVIVNATTSGMVVADTGSSGYGSITGTTSTGIAITANAGAQAGTDSKIAVTSGGGLTLQAGSGSAATLTGSTVGITGTTTFNSDVSMASGTAMTMDLFTNWVHDLSSETPSGTFTPDASTGNVKYIIPQGNLTINDFASGSIDPGQSITLFIDQSSYSTSYTLTMGSNFLFPGGTAPTLTGTGNDLITMTCLDDGTVSGGNIYIANFVANYQ